MRNELELMERLPQENLPQLSLDRARAVARELRRYVSQVGLTLRIGQSEYVRIEGWQFLCHLCGLPLPTIVSVRREERGEHHYAYVAEAVLEYGGREYRAFALCSSEEQNWRNKPEYALLSMAQTRACGKVLRAILGWILPIAGYAATPAEEMIDAESQNPPQAQATLPFQQGNGDTPLRQLRRSDPNRYQRLIASLRPLLEQVAPSQEERQRYLQERYGVRSLDELTLTQASRLYRELQGGGSHGDANNM